MEKDVSEDFGNMIWKPPANQTGDGRTSLNDKYGYWWINYIIILISKIHVNFCT